MKQNIDFKRGELVATARALLAAASLEGPDATTFEHLENELGRIIGNNFQLRGDLGDTIQLSLVILMMVGEEHSIAPVTR